MASTEELMSQYGVAWFGFDEASGNVYDKLGSNYVGTVTGTTRVAGWNGEGNAMQLNGTNQYATFNSKTIPVGEKSIRFKIKTTQSTLAIVMSQTAGSAHSGTQISITEGKLEFLVGRSVSGSAILNLKSSKTINDGKWRDILCVWNGTAEKDGAKIYIDDISIPDVTGTATGEEVLEPTYNLRLGASNTTTLTYYFNGQIDDLQIYSKALTSSDFTQNHIAIKTQDSKNLVLPNRAGRVKEIPSSEEVDLINQGYTWREIDNAVDSTGLNLTQLTTEYEKVSKSNVTLSKGKMFTIPISNFKTAKIENNNSEDKHLVIHDNQYKYHNGTSWFITTATEENFIQYGRDDLSHITEEQWQELQGTKSIVVWSDFEDKKYASVVLEKEPFTAKELIGENAEIVLHTTSNEEQNTILTEVDEYSVYNYISELPTAVAYTESTDDIVVSTTTEPFDLYDEFGDEIEILYYADDEAVTEADLILEANWSPVDELDGDFEVVTWTDEPQETAQRVLELTAIPKPQFIKLANPKRLYGYLESVLAEDVSQSYRNETRYLLSDANIDSERWYVWDKYTQKFVEVDISTHELILQNGMTYEEVNNISDTQWKTWKNDFVNIGIFLKDNPRDTIVSVIENISYSDYLPRHTTSIEKGHFYILNTTAKINLELVGNVVKGVLSDDNLTRVQYRVLLNNDIYFPIDGGFTDLGESPRNIELVIPSKDIVMDDWNTVKVEFQDFYGTTDYWQTQFIGNYSGLMFKDIQGDYFSSEIGEVLKYLDFGVIIAGQTTLEHEIILKNQYGYDVENIYLYANTSEFPQGMTIEFGESLSPFLPQPELRLARVLEKNEEYSFFVRLKTELGSTPNANGSFDIIVRADKVNN